MSSEAGRTWPSSYLFKASVKVFQNVWDSVAREGWDGGGQSLYSFRSTVEQWVLKYYVSGEDFDTIIYPTKLPFLYLVKSLNYFCFEFLILFIKSIYFFIWKLVVQQNIWGERKRKVLQQLIDPVDGHSGPRLGRAEPSWSQEPGASSTSLTWVTGDKALRPYLLLFPGHWLGWIRSVIGGT